MNAQQYRDRMLAPLGARHIGERCSDPLHDCDMKSLGTCRACGDVRYPDADERELEQEKLREMQEAWRTASAITGDGAIAQPETARFVITDEMRMAGIEAYQNHRHETPDAIVTAILEAASRA